MRLDSAFVRTFSYPASGFSWFWRRPTHEGLQALLVTDLEAFTSWVSKLGDSQARLWMREHNRIVRNVIERAGGNEVAHTGDGVIAAFRSVHAALACALQIHRSLAEHSQRGAHAPFVARIGVHAGEPLPEDGRLIGACVNAAVRVCGEAGAGRTLVTEVVRQLAQGHTFEFSEHGEASLKGMPAPYRLYELIERTPRVTNPA
jgi:adenylate cyclase